MHGIYKTDHMERYRQVFLERQYLFHPFCFSAIEQTHPNKRCNMKLLLLHFWSLQTLDWKYSYVLCFETSQLHTIFIFFHFLPSTAVRELQMSCTRDSISKFFNAASQTAPIIGASI